MTLFIIRRIVNCLEVLYTRLTAQGLLANCDGIAGTSDGRPLSNTTIVRSECESLDEFYVRELRPLLFGTFPAVTIPNAPFCHYFAKEATANKPDRDAVRAIFKDVTSLQQSLPITSSSSIFVRYDENNVCLSLSLV